ncbi:STAND family AAA ATPase [Thauera mechernichensis]
MTIAILHLSDIHICSAEDSILGRAEAIARPLFRHLPTASSVVIVLSGDIAQSGQASEYQMAKQMLLAIKESIEGERSDVIIHFVIAPGNHDCDFSKRLPVREVVLQSMEREWPDIPIEFIDTATSPQANYFAFRAELDAGQERVKDDKLWTTYLVSVEGKRVFFDVLNASWMSQRYEQQGKLLFPIEQYEAYRPTEADLRIGVLHHPFGWYSQVNQLRFRSVMHQLCDVLMTGHEHESGGRVSDDAHHGECAYIEGASLYERGSGASAFNVVIIDLDKGQFCCQEFVWDSERYAPGPETAWTSYRSMPRRMPGELTLSESFRKELCDPGATLRHPSDREIALHDVYVYPDLDVRDAGQDERRRAVHGKKTSSKILLQLPSNRKSVLLEGDELAGKTKLLFVLFSEYNSQGYLPLYLSGPKLRSSTDASVEGCIKAAIQVQYGQESVEAYLQAKKVKRILLLDDLDLSPLNGMHKAKLLERLMDRFEIAVVTVSEDFEFAELLGGEEVTTLAGFEQYRISPFGYERRGELIRKWMAFGATEETSPNELLRMEDEATRLIEESRLQHVASSVPIMILSLLQGTTSGLSKGLQNTSFASYYHFLIVGAFERAKVRAGEIPAYIAACTHLSWFVKRYGVEQCISETQFRQFVSEYSEEWTATEPARLLKVLTTARILEHDGDNIAFAYPYAYYFFLGKYASLAWDANPDVKTYLGHCLNHLYVRECANTLLFLAHHTGTSGVLDQLVIGLNGHFTKNNPATFSKTDVAMVAGLISQAPKLKYSKRNPTEYRTEQQRISDEMDSGDDGLRETPSSSGPNERDLLDELVSLNKSMEIAGALLSHQYANYNRTTKERAIRAIFDAAMRAVRHFYGYFEGDHEELIKSTVGRLSKKRDSLGREKLEQQVRLAIGWLLRTISTAFVVRAGSCITCDELADNVASVIKSSPSNANRLIRIAQLLTKPVRLPRVEIESLLREEHDNVCVMGILQSLVLHRMYMYETEYDDKDWAISKFKLSNQSTTLELRHRTRTAIAY